MVMRCSSPPARLSAASLLTERTNRVVNEAKLPTAARNQKGPALSAREASANPAMNSAGLKPFMAFSTCLSSNVVPEQMLAPPSDKSGRHGQACPGSSARGGAA
jgi:hypothetical protein